MSTLGQALDIPLARLKAEDCNIRSDKMSGGSREGRTGLATVIEFLHSSGELVVARADRPGRDTRDGLNIIREVEHFQNVS